MNAIVLKFDIPTFESIVAYLVRAIFVTEIEKNNNFRLQWAQWNNSQIFQMVTNDSILGFLLLPRIPVAPTTIEWLNPFPLM